LVTSHSQALTGLASTTVYHYRVKSNDSAGNLTVSSDQTFTTCPCGYSLWNNSTTPAVPSVNDASIEVGVKFTSDVIGYIKAIRFYKGNPNIPVHTVSLWSSTGVLLAQAQSSNETATGWQQVSFAASVAITANTSYVVSYHTTSYAYNKPY